MVMKKTITETVENIDGAVFHKNPTRAELLALMKKHLELRGVSDGRDVFVWPSQDMIHDKAVRTLGLAMTGPHCFYISRTDDPYFSATRQHKRQRITDTPYSVISLRDNWPAIQELRWIQNLVASRDLALSESSRKGLANIGRMNRKVFWNPSRPQLEELLKKSGDLRGGGYHDGQGWHVAFWPAGNLTHWSFFNELLNFEGVGSTDVISFRITPDQKSMQEVKDWNDIEAHESGSLCYAVSPRTRYNDVHNDGYLKKLFPQGVTEAVLLAFDEKQAVRNPSPERLRAMVKKAKYKDLRGIYDGADLFFWDASLGLHAHVARSIGVEYDYRRRLNVDVSYGQIEMTWDEGVPKHVIQDHYGAAGEFRDDQRLDFYNSLNESVSEIVKNPSDRELIRLYKDSYYIKRMGAKARTSSFRNPALRGLRDAEGNYYLADANQFIHSMMYNQLRKAGVKFDLDDKSEIIVYANGQVSGDVHYNTEAPKAEILDHWETVIEKWWSRQKVSETNGAWKDPTRLGLTRKLSKARHKITSRRKHIITKAGAHLSESPTEQVDEQWLAGQLAKFGVVEYFINPSKAELNKLTKGPGNGARGLITTTGDLVVWYMDDALHSEATEFLHKTKQMEFLYAHLIFFEGYILWNEMDNYLDDADWSNTEVYMPRFAKVWAKVMQNKHLKRLFGDFVITGARDETGEQFALTPEWIKTHVLPENISEATPIKPGSHQDIDFPMWKNPTRSSLQQLAKHGDLRGVVDGNGDILVWKAMDADHNRIQMKVLGGVGPKNWPITLYMVSPHEKHRDAADFSGWETQWSTTVGDLEVYVYSFMLYTDLKRVGVEPDTFARWPRLQKLLGMDRLAEAKRKKRRKRRQVGGPIEDGMIMMGEAEKLYYVQPDGTWSPIDGRGVGLTKNEVEAEGGEIVESFLSGHENWKGMPVELFKNPDKREYIQVLGDNDQVRALIHGDDLIIWNVFSDLHVRVMEQIKAPNTVVPVVIYGRPGDPVADIQVTDASKSTTWHHNGAVDGEIYGCAALNKLFNDFDISYYDEAIVGGWSSLNEATVVNDGRQWGDRVSKNPTRRSLEALLSRWGDIRGTVADNGEVYIWPAMDNTHASAGLRATIRHADGDVKFGEVSRDFYVFADAEDINRRPENYRVSQDTGKGWEWTQTNDTHRFPIGKGVLVLDDFRKLEHYTNFPKMARLLKTGVNENVIKLGSKSSPGLQAFMADYVENTSEHPINHRARLLNNAAMEVSAFDGMIHISDILALQPGGGRAALELLCNLADKHGVKMSLTAKSYDTQRATLDTSQLKAWYERHGFVEDEDTFGDDDEGYDMIRWPQALTESASQSPAQMLYNNFKGKEFLFQDLPRPGKNAVQTHFVREQGVKISPQSRWGYVEIPVEALIQVIGGREFSNFEEYHQWYVQADMPNHAKADYAVILDHDPDEVIYDGWHRFHDYVRKGVKLIPAVLPLESYDEDPLTENSASPSRLGDLITVKLKDEDADFWVTRRGSLETVGKPTREYNPEAYGIKVVRTDVLLPDYLFYMFQFLQGKGVFKRVAKGSLKLVNITAEQLKAIPIGQKQLTESRASLGKGEHSIAKFGDFELIAKIGEWGNENEVNRIVILWDGEQVGMFSFEQPVDGKINGHLAFQPGHRGSKIGVQLYRAIQWFMAERGLKLVPSKMITDGPYKIWQIIEPDAVKNYVRRNKFDDHHGYIWAEPDYKSSLIREQVEKLEEVNEISPFDDNLNKTRKREMWGDIVNQSSPDGEIKGYKVLLADDPNGKQFVLMDGKEPVGKVSLYRETQPYYTVKHIWFEPRVRNQGLGLAIYEYLLSKGYDIATDYDQTVLSKSIWKRLVQRQDVRELLPHDVYSDDRVTPEKFEQFYAKGYTNFRRMVALGTLKEFTSPPTDYPDISCFIKDDGEIIPVKRNSRLYHNDIALQNGFKDGENGTAVTSALEAGWIRVYCHPRSQALNLEWNMANKSRAALKKLYTIVQQALPHGSYMVEMQTSATSWKHEIFDGPEGQKKCLAFIRSQMGGRITESLTQAVEWQWLSKQPGHWIASFDVGGRNIRADFAGDKHVSVQFASLTDNGYSQGITGQGSSALILSTVVSILENFVKERRPDSFAFGAMNRDQSRVKLYRAVVKKITPRFPNYQPSENTDSIKETIWTFSKIDGPSGGGLREMFYKTRNGANSFSGWHNPETGETISFKGSQEEHSHAALRYALANDLPIAPKLQELMDDDDLDDATEAFVMTGWNRVLYEGIHTMGMKQAVPTIKWMVKNDLIASSLFLDIVHGASVWFKGEALEALLAGNVRQAVAMLKKPVTEGKITLPVYNYFKARTENIQVFENPTKSQLKQLVSKSTHGVRGCMTKDKFFVWNANDAIHDRIANSLHEMGEGYFNSLRCIIVPEGMDWNRTYGADGWDRAYPYDINGMTVLVNSWGAWTSEAFTRALGVERWDGDRFDERSFKPKPRKRVSEAVVDTLGTFKKPVYQNPSRAEYKKLVSKLTVPNEPDAIRGLLDPDTGDIYLWDGYYGAHGGLKDRYKLPKAFHLTIKKDQVTVLTLWRCKRDGYTKQQVHDLVTSNQHLKNILGDVKIMINEGQTETIATQNWVGFPIDLNVIWNPTLQQLKSLFDSSKDDFVRGLIHGKDIVVWDAYKTEHADAAKALGIELEPRRANRFFIHRYAEKDHRIGPNGAAHLLSKVPALARLERSGAYRFGGPDHALGEERAPVF